MATELENRMNAVSNNHDTLGQSETSKEALLSVTHTPNMGMSH
jgi:hypothetical protein